MKQKLILLIALCMLYCSSDVQCNDIKFIGNSFVVNYAPSVYKFDRQVWDICESDNGLMYFANGPLLEAGNNYWKKHSAFDNALRSVHSIGDNRILAGGNGLIGVFEPTIMPGVLSFTSLMDRLDGRYHKFGSVWQIFPYQEAFILRAGSALFRYENDTIVPLLYGDLINYAQIVNDTIFALVSKKGLGIISEGSFQLLPHGSFFSSQKIKGIFPFEGGKLIFTDDDGVFFLSEKGVGLYKPLSIKSIIESQISSVEFISTKYFAIGTVKDGLYIIDINGVIIQHISRKNGLQNSTIISMMLDKSGNLWLGLDNGISYVDLSSCITAISPDFDMGTGYVSKYFKGKMYLGTNQGLFYTNWDATDPYKNRELIIKPVANTSGQVWTLYESDNRLFCGHHKGLFEIVNDNSRQISETDGCWQIDSLISAPGYYLQSTYRGFFLLRFDQNRNLTENKKIDEIPSNTRTFLQDQKGYIWLTTSENKILRFKVEPGKAIEVNDFTDDEGLPEFSNIRLVGNKHQVFFSTDKGLYSYNYAAGKFVNNSYYDQIIGTGEICSEFTEDNYQRVWYVRRNEIGYFRLQYGNVEKVFLPFNKILDIYTRSFGTINIIDDDNILFGVEEGFYHYQGNCSHSYSKDYRSFIVSIGYNDPPVRWSSGAKGSADIPVFKHKRNGFDFHFTSNFFESQKNILYSYKLEGYDKEWSDWSERNNKEFNNLFEGTYTLKVKAKSNYGIETSVSTFSFVITPPYYRSSVAIVIYFLILAALFYLASYYRKKRLEIEKRKIVLKKQAELEQKKKKFEEEQILAKQRITELENERLQQDLLYKSKELSNSMINLLNLNEILRKIKSEIQKLVGEQDLRKRDNSTRNLLRLIDSEISPKKDLEIFDLNFSAVHEDFVRKIKERYPSLNHNDIRLCTFLKMNKSTKEIATLMNITIRGVETSRHRLRKKMELQRDDNLYDIISQL